MHKQKMHSYVSERDSNYFKYSVGNLIHGKIIEKYLQKQKKEYEFQKGVDSYKLRWTPVDIGGISPLGSPVEISPQCCAIWHKEGETVEFTPDSKEASSFLIASADQAFKVCLFREYHSNQLVSKCIVIFLQSRW